MQELFSDISWQKLFKVLPEVIAYILLGIVARARGYSFFFWLLLCVGASPQVALFVLAALPNRSLDRRREQEAARLLDDELAQAGLHAPALHLLPADSLGDHPTLR